MKSDRQTKFLAVIAILLAVGGLSIGFAALSQQLTIGGTATVEGSNWDIHFANLGAATLEGLATEETAPTLTSTTHMGDFDVTLKAPGDLVAYTFDIVNDGTFNARISEVIKAAAPTCTGTNADTVQATTDATNVCNNLAYTLTYTTGGATVGVNDTLNSGETKNVTLTLEYSDTVTEDVLPQAAVDISGLAITVVYNQTN